MNLFLSSLVVTSLAYAFSWLWFGPFMFKGLYERSLAKSNQARPYPRPLIFAMFFVLAYLGLATVGYFVYLNAGGNAWTGARVGLYCWILYLGLDFANALFSRLNLVVNVINWGYWILVCTLGGALFAALSRSPWPFA